MLTPVIGFITHVILSDYFPSIKGNNPHDTMNIIIGYYTAVGFFIGRDIAGWLLK